jgi:hypothetical protein
MVGEEKRMGNDCQATQVKEQWPLFSIQNKTKKDGYFTDPDQLVKPISRPKHTSTKDGVIDT